MAGEKKVYGFTPELKAVANSSKDTFGFTDVSSLSLCVYHALSLIFASYVL